MSESKIVESCLTHKVNCPKETQSKRTNTQNIENCPREELDKAIEKFYVEVCNIVTPIMNK